MSNALADTSPLCPPIFLSFSVCLGAGRVRVKLKKDFHFHFSPSPTSARSKKSAAHRSKQEKNQVVALSQAKYTHTATHTHTLVEARAKQIHETNPRSSHLHVKPAAEQPPNQAAAQSLSWPGPVSVPGHSLGPCAPSVTAKIAAEQQQRQQQRQQRQPAYLSRKAKAKRG